LGAISLLKILKTVLVLLKMFSKNFLAFNQIIDEDEHEIKNKIKKRKNVNENEYEYENIKRKGQQRK